jgi:AmmeMemoRadiSam system protein B
MGDSMIRKMRVNGQFYPSTKDELDQMVNEWSESKVQIGCRIAIVPHAGYVFSGESAWKAISKIDWSLLKRCIIIGPSHRVSFSGLSVSLADSYETLTSLHQMEKEFSQKIIDTHQLYSIEEAHHEHSTEVQVPLIDIVAPQIPIVEIVYGTGALSKLTELLISVINDKETGIIISSDLSHYYSEEVARKIDKSIVSGVKNLDLNEINRGEACGMEGIISLATAIKSVGGKIEVVDYRTSADSAYGESDRVVGYMSAVGEV